MPIIGDADRTYRALRIKTVDMVPLNLAQRAVEAVRATVGVAVRRGPSYVGTSLLLNVRRAPLDSPATRRAVSAALDLGRIVRNTAPAVAATEGFIHPASRWSAGARIHRFDPLAARAALAAIGRPLRVLAPTNDPVRLEAGRQVVLALRRAGAAATLVKVTRAQLERAIGATGAPADFDAAIQSVPALVSYDPNYLTRLFASDRAVAPLNFGGYSSERFDALARSVASAPQEAQRRRATAAELRLLAREVPAIPLFFLEGSFAFRSAVYDDWAFVKGAGILDKTSFLPGARPAAAQPPVAEEVAPSEDSDSGSGLGVVNVISLIVLAVVAVLIAVALASRRRRPSRR